MAGGCGVGAFCSFCGKCGRVFGSVFDAVDVPDVLPPGVSVSDAAEKVHSEEAEELVGEADDSASECE